MRIRSLRPWGSLVAAAGLGAVTMPFLATAAHAAPTTTSLEMVCMFGGTTEFDYDTDVTITAEKSPTTGAVEITADLSADMPNTAPAFVSVPASDHVAQLRTQFDGAPVPLSAAWVADYQGQVPIEIRTMTGSVSGGNGTVPVVIEGFDIEVGGVEIPCAPESPVEVDVTIEQAESLDGVPAEGQVTFSCTMPELSTPVTFPYVADVKVEGVRTDGTGPTVTLVASLSDLPGTDAAGAPLVPVFINAPNAPFTSTVKVKVDGQDVTLTGTGTTAVKGGEPIKVPDAQATITTSTNQLAIEVLSFDFVAQGMPGNCTAQSGGDLGDLTVDRTGKAVPPPGPSPSPSPDAPGGGNGKDKNKGKNKGTPATGTTTFKCVLGPFDSKFDYVADISISGMRAKESDSKVSLAGDFSKLPGIAPVPIDNGKMEIKTTMKIGGQDVELTGSSTVNAAIKAEVAVPRLTGSVDTDENDLTVEMTAFSFDFGEMAGAHIKAECEAADGAKLSNLKVGVGDLDDSGSGNDSGGSTGTTGATTLPKTGGADSIPVIALWAAALAMLGAAALMLMPRVRAGEE